MLHSDATWLRAIKHQLSRLELQRRLWHRGPVFSVKLGCVSCWRHETSTGLHSEPDKSQPRVVQPQQTFNRHQQYIQRFLRLAKWRRTASTRFGIDYTVLLWPQCPRYVKTRTARRNWAELNWHGLLFDEVTNEQVVMHYSRHCLTLAYVTMFDKKNFNHNPDIEVRLLDLFEDVTWVGFWRATAIV